MLLSPFLYGFIVPFDCDGFVKSCRIFVKNGYWNKPRDIMIFKEVLRQ